MAQRNEEIDPGIMILSIPKNPREEYRVYTRDYKGYKLADVRIWYSDRGSDAMKPGKGISLKVGVLPEVIVALQKIVEIHKGQETQPPSRKKQTPDDRAEEASEHATQRKHPVGSIGDDDVPF